MPDDSPPEVPFEQALEELEAIVQQLESGTFALEDLVTLYQRGRKLASRCQLLLDDVDLRLQQLGPDGDVEILAASFMEEE